MNQEHKYLEDIYLKEVSQLEPLVIETIGKVEEGLGFLDKQFELEKGLHRLDILACDINGSVVIIELKAVEANMSIIAQTINYHNRIEIYIKLLAKIFPEINPKKKVRIILIAPSFSEDVIITLEKINMIDFSLFEITTKTTSEEDNTYVSYKPITINIKSKYEIDDCINRITNEKLKEEVRKIIKYCEDYDNVFAKPHPAGRELWVEIKSINKPLDGSVPDIAFILPTEDIIKCETFIQKGKEKDYDADNKHEVISMDEFIVKCKGDIEHEINRINSV